MNISDAIEAVLEAAMFHCQCAGACTGRHALAGRVCGGNAVTAEDTTALCSKCVTGRANHATKTARSARQARRGEQLDILSLITEIGA